MLSIDGTDGRTPDRYIDPALYSATAAIKTRKFSPEVAPTTFTTFSLISRSLVVDLVLRIEIMLS